MIFQHFRCGCPFLKTRRKIILWCWLFPFSPHVQNSHFTGQDMIGESKRPRQSDRWTPRQDPREPTINLSEEGTFLLCPQAKNLGPSVLSSLSAGTKKLYVAPNTLKVYPHSISRQENRWKHGEWKLLYSRNARPVLGLLNEASLYAYVTQQQHTQNVLLCFHCRMVRRTRHNRTLYAPCLSCYH
jgi:hypothetical protein